MMKFIIQLRFATAIVLLAYAAVAPAQDATPPANSVDLTAVLRLAQEASPRLAIERQSLAGAEANRISAGALPNPSISYGRFRPRSGGATLFDGTRQEQVTFDVPLLVAGQRGARIDKADLEIEAARARITSGASTLSAEAGSAFVMLQAARDKLALLSASRDELTRLRNIVSGRTESGMASRYDLTRMEIELSSVQSKIEEARADMADRSGQLAALLGLPGWKPQAEGTMMQLPVPATLLARPRAQVSTSPALQSAVTEEKVAQSAIDIARRERWPVPSVSVGRSWTSEPYGSANFVGFSVEIPFLDSRKGPLLRAESEASAAKLRRELTEAEIAANLERYAGVITARQSALQRHDQDAASRLPALKAMAEDAYRLGRGTVFDLLDATRSRHEIQQARIELLSGLIDAQLRFLALGGEIGKIAPSAPGSGNR